MMLLLLQSSEEWADLYGAPEPETFAQVVALLLGNDVTSPMLMEAATGLAAIAVFAIHRTAVALISPAFYPQAVAPSVLTLGVLLAGGSLAILREVTVSQAIQFSMGTLVTYATAMGVAAQGGKAGDVSGVFTRRKPKGG